MSILPITMPRHLRQRRDLEAGVAASDSGWDGDFGDRGAKPKGFMYSGIPLVNSITVHLAMAVIMGLQYYKRLGGIATLISLSVVIAVALRPPRYVFNSLTAASLGVKVCFVAFYLVLVSLATFGLFLCSLATCHHCTCKWT